MDKWADYLDRVIAGTVDNESNVVPLRKEVAAVRDAHRPIGSESPLLSVTPTPRFLKSQTQETVEACGIQGHRHCVEFIGQSI